MVRHLRRQSRDLMYTMGLPLVSMSGSSGQGSEWSWPRARSRRNFWSKRPRSQRPPHQSVCVLEQRPSEDEGESDSELMPRSKALLKKQREETQMKRKRQLRLEVKLDIQHQVSPQTPRSSDSVHSVVTDSAKVEQLAGEIERKYLKAYEVMPTWWPRIWV